MPRISGSRRAWLGALVASSMGLLVLPLAHAQRQQRLRLADTSTAPEGQASPSTPDTTLGSPSTGAHSTAPVFPLTPTQPVTAAIPSEAPPPVATAAQPIESITVAPSVAAAAAVIAVEGASANAADGASASGASANGASASGASANGGPSNAAAGQAKAAEAAAQQAAAQAQALYDYYTNGAQVTSVPAEGPAAAYFQNAAELLTIPSSSIPEESPDLGAGVP